MLGEPTASRGPHEGQRWVYFLAPWGMQFELVSYPHGKAFFRNDEAAMTVATQRVADHLRSAILGGRIGPGERVRQEDIAQQLGASRLPVREALQMLAAEGLVENEPNKGARVPWLSMHEVDVMYRMREQLEPLALAESLPVADARRHPARSSEIQDEIEAGVDVERLPGLWTASSTCAPTAAAASSS